MQIDQLPGTYRLQTLYLTKQMVENAKRWSKSILPTLPDCNILKVFKKNCKTGNRRGNPRKKVEIPQKTVYPTHSLVSYLSKVLNKCRTQDIAIGVSWDLSLPLNRAEFIQTHKGSIERFLSREMGLSIKWYSGCWCTTSFLLYWCQNIEPSITHYTAERISIFNSYCLYTF